MIKGGIFLTKCKNNCSCCDCIIHCKPCDVLPVSKVLKGIDVCQILKCDCSGRVNIQNPDLEFTANICPHCNLQGSSVSTAFLGITFNSTTVNPPRCISTESRTTLQVTWF